MKKLPCILTQRRLKNPQQKLDFLGKAKRIEHEGIARLKDEQMKTCEEWSCFIPQTFLTFDRVQKKIITITALDLLNRLWDGTDGSCTNNNWRMNFRCWSGLMRRRVHVSQRPLSLFLSVWAAKKTMWRSVLVWLPAAATIYGWSLFSPLFSLYWTWCDVVRIFALNWDVVFEGMQDCVTKTWMADLSAQICTLLE